MAQQKASCIVRERRFNSAEHNYTINLFLKIAESKKSCNFHACYRLHMNVMRMNIYVEHVDFSQIKLTCNPIILKWRHQQKQFIYFLNYTQRSLSENKCKLPCFQFIRLHEQTFHIAECTKIKILLITNFHVQKCCTLNMNLINK